MDVHFQLLVGAVGIERKMNSSVGLCLAFTPPFPSLFRSLGTFIIPCHNNPTSKLNLVVRYPRAREKDTGFIPIPTASPRQGFEGKRKSAN